MIWECLHRKEIVWKKATGRRVESDECDLAGTACAGCPRRRSYEATDRLEYEHDLYTSDGCAPVLSGEKVAAQKR